MESESLVNFLNFGPFGRGAQVSGNDVGKIRLTSDEPCSRISPRADPARPWYPLIKTLTRIGGFLLHGRRKKYGYREPTLAGFVELAAFCR